jgi:hypothetical protein
MDQCSHFGTTFVALCFAGRLRIHHQKCSVRNRPDGNPEKNIHSDFSIKLAAAEMLVCLAEMKKSIYFSHGTLTD